jgi:outer membrane protein OmpA-like peptidoglycan-associated protein
MLKNAWILLFAGAALQVCAQDDEILAKGKVMDATTNKGIEAHINYSSMPTGSINGRFVDSTFSFPIFGAAKYQITAEAKGYNPRTIILDPEEINPGEKVTRDILLTPSGESIRLSHLIFSQGKAIIEPQSHQELDGVVQMMKYNVKIVIQLEGYTDNLGSAKANLKLSQNRVEAVKKYIVAKGIAKSRVKTKAFGGSQLLSNETTPEARNLNRRVEMRILNNDYRVSKRQ